MGWRWGPLVVVLLLGGVIQPWLRARYRPLGWLDVIEAAALVPLAAVAGVLLSRRPRTALGPLLAVVAVLFATARVADAAVQLDVSHGGSDRDGWRVLLYGLAVLPAGRRRSRS
jgi:hypothetical protein